MGFLQTIARPITIEEELMEAFRFFDPHCADGNDACDDSPASVPEGEQRVITKQCLFKVLTGMGEEITEAECADMIEAATGGLDVIDFQTFQRFSKPTRRSGGTRVARFEESAAS